MKYGKTWQQVLGATTVPLLMAIALVAPAIATNSPSVQTRQSSFLDNRTTTDREHFQLAQAADACRQVAVQGGLYVREDPSVYSRAVGIVEYRRNVTVETPGREGWVAVSAPLEGFMYSQYLVPCNPATPAPDNCREVSARCGLLVRAEPSVNADVIGIVRNGRNVTIKNLGASGWVPIQVPLEGYVSADYLTSCS